MKTVPYLAITPTDDNPEGGVTLTAEEAIELGEHLVLLGQVSKTNQGHPKLILDVGGGQIKAALCAAMHEKRP